MDFLREYPVREFRKFNKVMSDVELKKLYLFLHSLDLLVLLWICILVFKLNIYWISAAVGMTQHMVIDLIGNPIDMKGYCFVYRLCRRFKRDDILKKR